MTEETQEGHRVRVYLDEAGAPIADLPGSAGDFTLDTTELPDGPHRLRFETVEGDRVTGRRDLSFTVRNGPGIAVAGLDSRDEVRGTLSLTVGTTAAAIGSRLNIASLELHRGLPFWVGGFALVIVLIMAVFLATDPLHFREYRAEAAAVRSETVRHDPAGPAPTSPPANPMRLALTADSFLPILDFDPAKADSARGAVTYAQNCGDCHGAAGEGRSDQAATLGEKGIYPRLAGQPAAYTYRQLYSFAKGWRESDVMQALSSGFSPQDWADIAVYLEGLRHVPYSQVVPVGPDMLELARSLLNTGHPDRGVSRCDGCHGPDGVGVAPYFPALLGQDARYLAMQIAAFRNGQRRNDMLRLMQPVAHGLEPREIEALGLYFQNQRQGPAN